MSEFINLVGMRFERLIVTRLVKKAKHTKWECLCDCGKIKIAHGSNLRGGKTKSCGCLRIEQATARLKKVVRYTLPEGKGSCNFLMNRYKQAAKKRNLEFNLTSDEFQDLTSKNCHYCGQPPKKKIKGKRSNGSYTFNGIDRINSNEDYTKENCVSCCYFCNYAKNDYSLEEFMEWIHRLVEFRKAK